MNSDKNRDDEQPTPVIESAMSSGVGDDDAADTMTIGEKHADEEDDATSEEEIRQAAVALGADPGETPPSS